ncbi:hypothetical protein [Blastococcus sp. TF02-09]|uniref:hypothetical protein n=1 Tax=Blastococcus sp. TF02-09 TaxID=2250576 RepID=UPI0011BE72E6|nr:hypothetical protein [Blastococcus sp. TF02-9]
MISTTWTDAPAGFSGPGRTGMSPYACSSVVDGGVARTVMAPAAAPLWGTGVPVAARLRPIEKRGIAHESFLQALVVATPLIASTDTTDIHPNATTLGIHPPGRPQS